MLKRMPILLAALFSLLVTHGAFANDLSLKWMRRDGTVLAGRNLALSELDRLPQSEIRTTTPWLPGPRTFAGPALDAIAALEPHPTVEARLTALNDYAVTIPVEDWHDYRIILASRMDGTPMRVRDKGPYWIIYPLDSDRKLQNQFYHARMIWQVREIVFISN